MVGRVSVFIPRCYATVWGGASLADGTARKSPSPVPGVLDCADTVASHAVRARNGLHICVYLVGGAQGQIGQLIERRNAFLTLAL